MQTLRTPDVADVPTAPARSRVMAALFSGAALMNAAMAVASAVSSIVIGDRLGAGWGGVPTTAGIVGTGTGALALTWLMSRYGRRTGLALGYVASALGGGLAVAAVARGDVLALTVGMLLLGLGNAGAQLSRYAAAELYPAERRGFAIGTVIWAGTVGAVGGPLLIEASNDAAASLGWTALTGPFVVSALAAGVAAVVVAAAVTGQATGRTAAGRLATAGTGAAETTAPDGRAMEGGGVADTVAADGLATAATGTADTAAAGSGPEAVAVPARMHLRGLAGLPAARSALAVMVTAQVVMVGVMTATPLDMHMRGEGLGAVGMVLSAHTLGMFLLSPLTGRLFDRLGARPVMFAGLVILALSTGLAAATSGGHPALWAAALFLLGYGWNLCFVGGSGRLARDLPESERARVEGSVDAAVWTISAAASLASTVILSAGGYATLAGVSCALLTLPATLLLKGRAR